MIFTPPLQAQPTCPIHGQHQNGWLALDSNPNQGAGFVMSMRLCGPCVIALLRHLGYTVTEPEKPETLKESDWILDELPEVKK